MCILEYCFAVRCRVGDYHGASKGVECRLRHRTAGVFSNFDCEGETLEFEEQVRGDCAFLAGIADLRT